MKSQAIDLSEYRTFLAELKERISLRERAPRGR